MITDWWAGEKSLMINQINVVYDYPSCITKSLTTPECFTLSQDGNYKMQKTFSFPSQNKVTFVHRLKFWPVIDYIISFRCIVSEVHHISAFFILADFAASL